MTETVIPPPARPALPVAGSEAVFPVRRVYCVGRNYAEHAREMGHDPDREPPFFFQKNPDDIVTDGRFPYPPGTGEVHFEIELVAALAAGGRDIAEADALASVWGYGVGLDMTRRDLQGAAKKAGRPWEIGKAFDASAPMSALVPASVVGHPAEGRIWLSVDGVTRQEGDLSQMIWPLREIIVHLSHLFTLAPGDLIMTGTPAGVGPVSVGDTLTGGIDGLAPISLHIGPAD